MCGAAADWLMNMNSTHRTASLEYIDYHHNRRQDVLLFWMTDTKRCSWDSVSNAESASKLSNCYCRKLSVPNTSQNHFSVLLASLAEKQRRTSETDLFLWKMACILLTLDWCCRQYIWERIVVVTHRRNAWAENILWMMTITMLLLEECRWDGPCWPVIGCIPLSLWRMAGATADIPLPSELKSITTSCLIPNYTAANGGTCGITTYPAPLRDRREGRLKSVIQGKVA